MSEDRGGRGLPADVMYCPMCASIISRTARSCDYCDAVIPAGNRAARPAPKRREDRPAARRPEPAAAPEAPPRPAGPPRTVEGAGFALILGTFALACAAAALIVPVATAPEPADVTPQLAVITGALHLAGLILGLGAIQVGFSARRLVDNHRRRGASQYRGRGLAGFGMLLGVGAVVAAVTMLACYVIVFTNPESPLREQLPLTLPEWPPDLFKDWK